MGACVVVDTNIVLDLLVFNDPGAAVLQAALREGRASWLATAPMREELSRVLAYPQIVPRLDFYGTTAGAVLAAFDAQARLVPVAPPAPWRCKDPDDQRFIDLAVAHRATLLSKDKAVICMRKRLLASGVAVCNATEFVA
ncbi:MAG TPA: putative toxin-antitoxin system toxin component, PIN family [Burkholderiaceae bacterium]